MHGINQYRFARIISIISQCVLKKRPPMMATANIVGYILFIRRLYQFGNWRKPSIGLINRAKPEQKKNRASPMPPPVARKLYSPYNIPI